MIAEAMAADSPLTIGVLGPLSTVASAILLEPRLVERDVTVVWIGGPPYDGLLGRTGGAAGIEFNLSNDIAAANVVMGSGIRVVQVPEPTYRMCSVGYPELREKIGDAGPLGEYLVRQLIEWNDRWNGEAIERRSLGDSPAVGMMLNPGGGVLRRRPAPRFADDGTRRRRPWPHGRGGRVLRYALPLRGHVREDPGVRRALSGRCHPRAALTALSLAAMMRHNDA